VSVAVGGGGGVAVPVGALTAANAFGTKTGALALTSCGEVVCGGGGSGAGDAKGLESN
jgi:hypothetical protein